MTLESWQPANNTLPMSEWMVVKRGLLIPDTRLQTIADAWWGMTEEQQIAIGEICEGYEDDAALDVLLDTLKQTTRTEENNPIGKSL